MSLNNGCLKNIIFSDYRLVGVKNKFTAKMTQL